MNDRTDWMDVADGGSKVCNRVNDLIELWKLQSCFSHTRKHFGTVCSHVLCVVLDYVVMKENKINNDGVTNRETVVPKMIFAGLMCLALLSFVLRPFDPKLMFAYLTYFWCATHEITERNEIGGFANLAYHNYIQCQKPVDAENMTSLIVQKKTIVTTLDYYKLLWTDKVHADAAAATVFVFDGFYRHHVHIADHMPFWTDGEYADSTTTGALSHRASYKSHEHKDDAGDNGAPRTKVFETESWVMQFSKFPLLHFSGMVGWQNADFDKQKHEKNKKHVFRPSRQQQHEATALGLNEASPLASLACTLRKACTTILTTASTKRQ